MPHITTRFLSLAVGFGLAVSLATAAHACGSRPGTPTDVAAEPLSSSSILFRWRETTRESERPLGVPTHDIEVTDANGAQVGRSLTGVGNFGARRVFEKLDFNRKYCFRIRARTEPGTQGCVSARWSGYACATTPVPPLVTGCRQGLVRRLASRGDRVCVTPASRDLIAQENRTAASRRSPNGGAYGPNTCRQGFVWREAFNGDVVCVTPARRAEVKAENARR
ncbi:MAG: fibronectin type III domain-containing protein [Hyphomicrobiaceae bacterium]